MGKLVRNDVLQPAPSCDTMGVDTHICESLVVLDRNALERLERQLIPLLNTVRLMQGKRPVIVLAERRTHE